jgi:hypothetical protein
LRGCTHICSTGVQLGRTGRQEDQSDVLGHGEIAGRVPAGAVEEQHGVGAPGDRAGYLLEVKLHGVGVGEGQRQAWTDAQIAPKR